MEKELEVVCRFCHLITRKDKECCLNCGRKWEETKPAKVAPYRPTQFRYDKGKEDTQ